MFNSAKLYQKVKNDYNKIAEHFSQTRQWQWPEFSDFKPYLKNRQRILDIGCGNGRLYFSFLKDFNLEYHGIDNNERLIKIAESQLIEIIRAIRALSFLRKQESNFLNAPSLSRFLTKSGMTDDSLSRTAPQYEFQVGEITNLSFDDNYFDIVFCIATLHHLPSKELRLRALSEIKRVLKPGGYLLMTNWYWWRKFPWKYFFNKWWQKISWNDLFILWKNPQGEVITDLYYHAFTKSELKKIIEEAGLVIEKIYLSKRQAKEIKKSKINLITICKK